MKMLAKKPGDRHESMQEVFVELRSIPLFKADPVEVADRKASADAATVKDSVAHRLDSRIDAERTPEERAAAEVVAKERAKLFEKAGRIHHPVDRHGRMLVRQLGILILINIAFGFAVSGIDNAAHLGGLAAGLWLGAMIPPTRVPTMAALWQNPDVARTSHLARVPVGALGLAFGVVVVVVIVGLLIGAGQRA
jgi:hypothetical protein